MKPDIAGALADIDSSFAACGDRLEALSAVALAAKTGTPIPPAIGKWLHDAIQAYRTDKDLPLEAALGLNAAGPANPRLRARKDGGLQADLGRMMVLHMIGASVPGAAAMVERVSHEQYTASTLADRFRRSGLGAQARQERADALQRYHWREIEAMLAEYPDHGIEVAEAKASIRAMYAKQRI